MGAEGKGVNGEWEKKGKKEAVKGRERWVLFCLGLLVLCVFVCGSVGGGSLLTG